MKKPTESLKAALARRAATWNRLFGLESKPSWDLVIMERNWILPPPVHSL